MLDLGTLIVTTRYEKSKALMNMMKELLRKLLGKIDKTCTSKQHMRIS